MSTVAGATEPTSPERAQTGSRRRKFAALTIVTVMALIGALVFAAVSAEGREISRASSNDGGAWFVNREFAAVGHKNRSTGELSSFVRVSDSPTADVYQAADLIVVHDAATNQLLEVDSRTFNEDLEPTQLPEFTEVAVVDSAVLVYRNDPLAVWRVDAQALSSLTSLENLAPLYSSASAGQVAVTEQGRVVVANSDDEQLFWIEANGTTAEPIGFDVDGAVVDLTVVDASAVVLGESGDLAVVGQLEIEHTIVWAERAPALDSPVVLQQPQTFDGSRTALPAQAVVGVTEAGALIRLSFGVEGPVISSLGALGGSHPLAPIVHEGCIYAVVTDPAVLAVACGDDFRSRRLEGAGQELRLRLVNGWVWVNDVTDGGTWVTNSELEVEELHDWGMAAETQDEADEDDGGGNSTNAEQTLVEDPDALGDVEDADDFDPADANVPPVAVDDETSTRVDRATVVPVLRNDTDANNDILVVTSVELLDGANAQVYITPSGRGVQVTPNPGFSGRIQLRYFISDGRSDPVSAIVTVEVIADESTNSPPIATTDVVATAPGHTTTIDVLRNDVDPDGDSLSLAFIEAPTGTLRWAPRSSATT